MTEQHEMSLATFDPESIRIALGRDLVAGLRAIADAIEAKSVDGQLIRVMGNGLRPTSAADVRMHIDVLIDIAAPIYQWRAGKKLPLIEAPTILLPKLDRSKPEAGR